MSATITVTAEIVLPHSGLRVPHTRLTASDYRGTPTDEGEAFTATLRLDDVPVGTINDRGDGGATWIDFHPGSAFSGGLLDAFASQCRSAGGAQVSAEDVLHALITEYEYGLMLSRARARDGWTLARQMEYVLDRDGQPKGEPYPRQVFPCTNRHPSDRYLLAHALNRRAGSMHAWWQVWDGQRWDDLTKPLATRS